MAFELPPLPYAYDALEPWLSAQTLRIHHDVLHARYVNRLNELAPDTSASLDSIVRDASPGEILNQALQVWNHDFLWKSMTPWVENELWAETPLLDAAVEAKFATEADFVDEVEAVAKSLFGSGYVWLLASPTGELVIWPANNAGNPLREMPGFTPLLTVDIWEHAYFLDYAGERMDYVDIFLGKLANWEFAEANYARAMAAR